HLISPTLPISILVIFHDAVTTHHYSLSLHDALPISSWSWPRAWANAMNFGTAAASRWNSNSKRRLTSTDSKLQPSPSVCSMSRKDRKSTRLNSSHLGISYAVFCLKKKKKNNKNYVTE